MELDKQLALDKIANQRAGLKAVLAQIDADLAREREKRSAAALGRVEDSIVEARIAGASKSAIMRAYGTTDFRTVNTILERRADEINRGLEFGVSTTWFKVHSEDSITIFGAPFTVISLADDEYMLDLTVPAGSADEEARIWDGIILMANTPDPKEAALYQAIKEVENG